MEDPEILPVGRTRETKIYRDDRGRWFNDGVRITHVLLSQAFDRWLLPAPDGSGRWCLSNQINWAYVSIDGPPRFVRRVSFVDGEISVHLSDGRTLPLDASTLEVANDGALYCEVSGLRARFDRHAMMQLEPVLDEDEVGVYLRVNDARIRPRIAETNR